MKQFTLTFFLAFTLNSHAQNSYVELFTYPPVAQMNWSSPNASFVSLMTSKAKQSLKFLAEPNIYRSLVGHAIIHFECIDSQGLTHNDWVGMTGQNDTSVDDKLMFEDQIGLGAMFYSYVDGSIDTPEKSRHQVGNYVGRTMIDVDYSIITTRPEFIRLPIADSKKCDDLVQYAKDLRSVGWDGKTPLEVHSQKPVGQFLQFGFTHDAYDRYQEWKKSNGQSMIGGGCTSLAVSFLKMSEVKDLSFLEHWTQHLQVSEKLIGGKGRAAEGLPEKVSLSTILLKDGFSWTHEGYQNRSLSFFDPEKMWSYIHQTRICVEGGHCTKNALRFIKQLRKNYHVMPASSSFEVTKTFLEPKDPKKQGAYLLVYQPEKEKRFNYKETVKRLGIQLLPFEIMN